ncbi:HlyD family secretion protein [Haloferula sp.]|uniref:HlyD family secretion protein n=1 Tax=Haloferula sp. TaxID=2497595 RepID=UPI003C778218
MLFAIVLLLAFILFVWLVFFKLKWLKLSPGWAIVSLFFVAHVLLIFMIGLRFMTPYSSQAKIVQHTIQLIPRLSEPTLVTAVLVDPDVPVKKGQPLFEFDKRIYQAKVDELEAQLAAAKQDVKVLESDVDVSVQKVAKIKAEMVFTEYQKKLANSLAAQGAGPMEEAQRWDAQLVVNQAQIKEAEAELARAKLNYDSQIDGVNTGVAEVEAKLAQAHYYLNNTTLVAPEDGRIVNLQVRPGMVSGDIRFGAIASFICDDGRYLLANYDQEGLKYVTPGKPVEVAFDLYPGQVFPAKVEAIWKASGVGQLLPSGNLPVFERQAPEIPQDQFAVKIVFDDEIASKFPIGAEGSAAIYTGGMTGAWTAIRRVIIRKDTWMNWLYPLPF